MKLRDLLTSFGVSLDTELAQQQGSKQTNQNQQENSQQQNEQPNFQQQLQQAQLQGSQESSQSQSQSSQSQLQNQTGQAGQNSPHVWTDAEITALQNRITELETMNKSLLTNSAVTQPLSEDEQIAAVVGLLKGDS